MNEKKSTSTKKKAYRKPADRKAAPRKKPITVIVKTNINNKKSSVSNKQNMSFGQILLNWLKSLFK